MNLIDILQKYIVNSESKGADDTVPIMASEGEYMIPANIVALLGDGNSEAGAEILDRFIADLSKVNLSNGEKLMDVLGQGREE